MLHQNKFTYTKSEQFGGLEVIVIPSGEAYVTQSSFSRFTGKPKLTISDWANKLEIVEISDISAIVEIPDISEFENLSDFLDKSSGEPDGYECLFRTKIDCGATGEKIVTLIPAKIFAKWLVKCNHPLVDELLELGATQFLYKTAGYKIGVKEDKPNTTADMLLMYAEIFKELASRLSDVEVQNQELVEANGLLTQENQLLKERVELVELETELNTYELERFKKPHGCYYSIIGYCSKHGISGIDVNRVAIMGKKASLMCRQRNITPEKINDPCFGAVTTYPEFVLDELDW